MLGFVPHPNLRASSLQNEIPNILLKETIKNFADESKLLSHFEKHGNEFRVSTSEEYLQIGFDIINYGQKVEYLYKDEIRTGYVSFMGNNSKGQAKFGFVGTNTDGIITTIHTESGKSFWKMLNQDSKEKVIKEIK